MKAPYRQSAHHDVRIPHKSSVALRFQSATRLHCAECGCGRYQQIALRLIVGRQLRLALVTGTKRACSRRFEVAEAAIEGILGYLASTATRMVGDSLWVKHKKQLIYNNPTTLVDSSHRVIQVLSYLSKDVCML
jgi:hypothetical protein